MCSISLYGVRGEKKVDPSAVWNERYHLNILPTPAYVNVTTHLISGDVSLLGHYHATLIIVLLYWHSDMYTVSTCVVLRDYDRIRNFVTNHPVHRSTSLQTTRSVQRSTPLKPWNRHTPGLRKNCDTRSNTAYTQRVPGRRY